MITREEIAKIISDNSTEFWGTENVYTVIDIEQLADIIFEKLTMKGGDIMGKPFVNFTVEEKGNAVEELHAKLAAAFDLMAILKIIKSLLKALGLWDNLISGLQKLKDQTPAYIDSLIDMIVAYLEAL